MTAADTTVLSISLADTAAILGCSYSHVYRLASRGELPGAYRLGHRWLVHRARLIAAIESQASSPGVLHNTGGDSRGGGAFPPASAAAPSGHPARDTSWIHTVNRRPLIHAALDKLDGDDHA